MRLELFIILALVTFFMIIYKRRKMKRDWTNVQSTEDYRLH